LAEINEFAVARAVARNDAIARGDVPPAQERNSMKVAFGYANVLIGWT
jgi:hypothetical protein